MRYFLFPLLLCCMYCSSEVTTYSSFDEYPVYTGGDLGLTYTSEVSVFKLWSPGAEEARVLLYEGDGIDPDEQPLASYPMKRSEGVWVCETTGDQQGKYYTFQIMKDGRWLAEAPDIYARAVGTNGKRAQIVDMSQSNPEAWQADQRPIIAQPTDMVIYEMHIRDISVHASSGNPFPGKFLGLTQVGTSTANGQTTGLDHLLEMGITHVHILPAFDFASLDESPGAPMGFNWGYDPLNYNVPEGTYATDASNGLVRIREFKQMVQALHQAGIGVIMDVVYNHTGPTDDSPFNLLVPGYYYRTNPDGSWSDASGCGNETASERPMVRDYIRQSVKYWAEEYHVDGFRFDLMGIHDIETMNAIAEDLQQIDPSIFVYGEGWTAGGSPLPDSLRALKANVPQLRQVAAFSDDLRDGLKGSVFNHEEQGFVSGAIGRAESVKFGVVAAGQHPQLDYQAVNYSNAPWAPEPSQCINYVSCHDNHTLWDRLQISNADNSEAERERMHRLSLAVVLTSQGVPFLHAGTELLRTKQGEENSYKSPDNINAIDWTRKGDYATTLKYVQDLIELRRAHSAFRMATNADIQSKLQFMDTEDEQLIAYRITNAPDDEWTDIVVIYNAHPNPVTFDLPEGSYQAVVYDDRVDQNGIGPVLAGSVRVPSRSCMVLR
ncbi:MAG: type I pullulanase [Bacteroidota bacterium]